MAEGDRGSGVVESRDARSADAGRQLVFEDRVLIEGDRADLWRTLEDPEFLARCIPGSSDIERESETRYSLDITRSISRLTLRIDGTIEIVEMAEPDWLVIEGTAYDSRTHSSFTGTAALEMSSHTEETVELVYRAYLNIEGGTAILTRGLLRSIVESDVERYFDNVERYVHGREEHDEEALCTGKIPPENSSEG